MNKITLHQPNMPASFTRQMNHNLSNITQVGIATKAALEMNGEIFRHKLFTFLTEANNGRFLLQAYELANEGCDLEPMFFEWLEELKTQMDRCCAVMGDKQVQILEGIPTDTQPPGFWEEFFSQLYNFFFGEPQAPESAVDQIQSLGFQTKQALTDTARTHSTHLPNYLNRTKEEQRGQK